MQAIYEVRIQVEEQVREAFQAWLKPHMQVVVEVGGFHSAQVFIEQGSPSVFVCHYYAGSTAVIDKYVRDKSAELREAAVARFGSRFHAERRVLEVLV